MGSREFEDVEIHSQWPTVSADMRGQPNIQDELEYLKAGFRDAGLEQSQEPPFAALPPEDSDPQ